MKINQIGKRGKKMKGGFQRVAQASSSAEKYRFKKNDAQINQRDQNSESNPE